MVDVFLNVRCPIFDFQLLVWLQEKYKQVQKVHIKQRRKKDVKTKTRNNPNITSNNNNRTTNISRGKY